MKLPQIGLGCANVMKAGLLEQIEVAARNGFSTITVRPLAFVDALEEGSTEKALRRRLADAGVRVTLIDALTSALPGVPPVETISAELRAHYPRDVLAPPDEETCFSAAEALEAPVVNLTHYRGRLLPLLEMAEAVGQVAGRAGSRGLRLALEFIPDTGLPDLPFAQAVIEACGRPNCGITLDFFHLDRTGGTVADVRGLPANAIINVQLSDRTPPQSGSTHVPMTGRQLPGEGLLPLGALIEAAFTNSPAATLDIEVLNSELGSLSSDETAGRLAQAARNWTAAL